MNNDMIYSHLIDTNRLTVECGKGSRKQLIFSKLLKFADNTKVFRNVSCQLDVDSLREDLLSLFKWSEEWLMLFNIDKCKVMHFGHKNLTASYS